MSTVHSCVPALVLGTALGVSGCSTSTDAQSGGAPVPYKLGMFSRGSGTPFVGLVLQDTRVVEVGPANAAHEAATASAPKLMAPADMTTLIGAYDASWKARLAAIAREVSTASAAPAYVSGLDGLRVHPPVRPAVILNAGGNYVEHSDGIAAQQRRQGQAQAPAAAAVSAPASGNDPPTTRATTPTSS